MNISIGTMCCCLLMSFSMYNSLPPDKTNNKLKNQLIGGVWVFDEPTWGDTEELGFIKRKKEFGDEGYGYQFLDDGVFILRRAYEKEYPFGEVDGEWEILENGNVKVDYVYTGCYMEEEWKILDIKRNSFAYKFENFSMITGYSGW